MTAPLAPPFPARQFWHRRDVQLGGAIALAAVLPFAVAVGIEPSLIVLPLFPISFLGSATGIVTGFWLFRNLIAFPGIRASYYIPPVFLSTFGAVFAALFMMRLDYSRPLLVAGLTIAALWFYIVYFMVQRRQLLNIAVVPFGKVASLYTIDTIVWIRLEQPQLPAGCAMLVADFDHDLTPDWERFLAECALSGISVIHYKQLRQSLTGQVEMERLSENAFGSLVPSATYLAVKRVADFVIALALLPLALPLMLGIAALVKLDSPGPVFFRQTRIGYRGRPFRVWKFRTMHGLPVDLDRIDAIRRLAMTAADDARITRIGRVLRRTRIDEVPQILNVLAGEMSWIGPRPEAAILSKWYETEIPFYRYRHIVRPGISGWAQVSQGHVCEIDDVFKKLSYDFFYISRFTFWIDMLIVVRTIKTLLTGFGSR
jgi:lipopolysaccharide/colanic/teichoic acid biosynthesis glycosyltransferase